MDALAAGGAPFNRFHVTSLCSPTRASFFTGRNHHAVGMGFLADIPLAFPGYHARLPKTAAALPRLLRDAGYSTLAVGKWHLTPRWQRSAAGPFDTWPLGLGFERYYGFLQGDTNHWTPNLVCDNHYVEPPRRPEEGYHLSEDLADQAVRMVQDQQQGAPGKPFFLYFALGRHARAAPRRPRVGRPLPRRLRQGVGRLAGGAVRAPGRLGHRARGHGAHAAARMGAGLERPLGGRAAHARPPAGGLRRLPDPHRRPDRPGALVAREPRGDGQHAGPGLLRQRRQCRGGQGRQRQRAPVHARTSASRWPTTSRTTTTGAASAPTTTTRGPGPGPATPRTSSGSATPGWAGPAPPSSSTGAAAIAGPAPCAPSSPTPST